MLNWYFVLFLKLCYVISVLQQYHLWKHVQSNLLLSIISHKQNAFHFTDWDWKSYDSGSILFDIYNHTSLHRSQKISNAQCCKQLRASVLIVIISRHNKISCLGNLPLLCHLWSYFYEKSSNSFYYQFFFNNISLPFKCWWLETNSLHLYNFCLECPQ